MRRGAGEQKETEISPETPLTLERTQDKRQKLKHRNFADSRAQSRSLGHEFSSYPGSLAVSAVFKRESMVLPALRDDHFRSHSFSMVASHCAAFIPEKHRASLFFSVEEVKLLAKLAWGCRAYEYARGLALEGQKETSIWRRAASLYKHRSVAAFFAERASETA